MSSHDRDIWDERAYGWCLVDLVKRDAQSGGNVPSPHLAALAAFTVPKGDDVLAKSRQGALALFQEGGGETARAISNAQTASKAGQHAQAAAIYTDLLRQDRLGSTHHTAFGWDLEKATKAMLPTGLDGTCQRL
jgi:hypothetical protein